MQTCAYCNAKVQKLTKEHLWPASLHKRISEVNRAYFGRENVFFLSKINKAISGEPKVKDVCSRCNNVILSELDAYICELWDKYLSIIVEAEEEVLFSSDFNLLSRWLLKMSFNSARIHNSDVEHLRLCRQYILGQDTIPENIVIHLQLAKPSDYTQAELKVVNEIGLKTMRHEPRLNRIGHFGYLTRSGLGRLVRAVHLQSYLFLIHVFPENVTEKQRSMDLEDFNLILPYAKRLNSESKDCLVKCEGMDSKESFYSHYIKGQFHHI